MPDYQSLESFDKKYGTLESFDQKYGTGGPTASQQDFSREELIKKNFAKTPDQLREEIQTQQRLDPSYISVPGGGIVEKPPSMPGEPAGIMDLARGAWRSTGESLLGMAGKAAGGLYDDVSNFRDVISGKKESSLYKNFIGDPTRDLWSKAQDPNRSASERFGYGLATFAPGGSIAADIGERFAPNLVYGTPKEQMESAGEGLGIALTPAAVRGTQELRKMGAARRLRKGYAKVADWSGEDITKAEVGAGFPLFDDYLKKKHGTNLSGAPNVNLRNMTYREMAPESSAAVADFFETNVKPVQAMLGNVKIPMSNAWQKGMDTIGLLTKEKGMKKVGGQMVTQEPPFVSAYKESFNKPRTLSEAIAFREEINGMLSDAYNKLQTKTNFNDFIRSNPRGKFLNALQDGIRESIDMTLDAYAGEYAGQAKAMFADSAKMIKLDRAIQEGSRRADLADTALDAQTLMEQFPLVRAGIALLTGGKFGSMGGTTHELTRLERGKLKEPAQRLKQAGKMIEKPGWGGIIPAGRTAMEPVARYNWSPTLANISPQNPLMPPGNPPGGGGGNNPPPPGAPPAGSAPPVKPAPIVTPGGVTVDDIMNIIEENKKNGPPQGAAQEAKPAKAVIPQAAPRPKEARSIVDSEAIETTQPRRVKKPIVDSEAIEKSAEKPVRAPAPVVQPRVRERIATDQLKSKKDKSKTAAPPATSAPLSNAAKNLSFLESYTKEPGATKVTGKEGSSIHDAYPEPGVETAIKITEKSVSELKKASDETKAEIEKSFAAIPKKNKAAPKVPNPETVAKMKEKLAASKKEKSVPKEEFNYVKDLGGTTGAKLYKDKDGYQYVVKHGKSEAHATNEYDAYNLYSQAGVTTPFATLKTIDGKKAVVSDFIGKEGETKPLGQVPDKQKYYKKIQEGFVADALFANWDVIGKDFDNIIVSSSNHIYRIDPGGALRFRAQGKPKQMSPIVNEIETMRDATQNPQAAEVFSGITDSQIRSQLNELLTKKDSIMKAVPEDLKQVMGLRFDDLQTRLDKINKGIMDANTKKSVKAPPTGTIKSGPTLVIKPVSGGSGWIVKDDTGKIHKKIETAGPEGAVEAKEFIKKKLAKALKKED